MPGKHGDDILGAEGGELIFDAGASAAAAESSGVGGNACRMIGWSLSGFQKVGVLTNGATGRSWRMASDEGPNLNGWDAAPPPLGFLSVGFALAFAEEIAALARLRKVDLGTYGIEVDNFYTIEGRMRDKTMRGGALPVVVSIVPDREIDHEAVVGLVQDAVHVASVTGAIRGSHVGRFRAVLNGAELDLQHAKPTGALPTDPLPNCAAFPPVGATDILIPNGWSRKSESPHPLHVSAAGHVRSDLVLELTQELRAPCGSAWRFRAGGAGAPDAVSYVSAGIGFCFMTQMEILAGMHGVNLDAVRIVQDTRFGPGGASSGTGRVAAFEPVETHVFIESRTASPAQVVELIDLAERACYLHALCRTPLKPQVRVRDRIGEAG
ncbi:OsmC family protein [Tropicimonas aquimaris]|uniref:OsmC family protein n=1 Tax=Tropicimonas aquimaris TaxID=914152 RepID=A0ABW3IP94_9RHOB